MQSRLAGLLDAAPRIAPARPALAARWLTTPIGAMLAVAGDAGLHLLDFAARAALSSEVAWLRERSGRAVAIGAHPHLDAIERELAEYFCGARRAFGVPLVLDGTPFEVRHWRALLRIPCGQTRSYRELAGQCGGSGSPRAVGRANGANRLSIVVPCHRVIGADGALVGYGGGLRRKRWLLDHERSIAGRAPPHRDLLAPRRNTTDPVEGSTA